MTTISQIEKGRNDPSSKVLKKIADALDASTDFLLGRAEKLTSKLKIQDKELLWHFQEIDKLDKKDRETIKELLEAFLMKKAHKKSSKK